MKSVIVPFNFVSEKRCQVFLDYPENGGCKLLRRLVGTSVPVSTKL